MSPAIDRGRPPAKETAPTSNTTDTEILPSAADEPANFDPVDGMRRRREAALRLEPLADGKRDPQFGFARDGASV